MPRQPLNLSIDPDVLERARRFSERHGTSLSQLVNDFFSSLPLEPSPDGEPYAPAVRRLIGIARGDAGAEDYRRFLLEKYGE